MANTYFEFKQFRICQDLCAMKVGTDGVLLGAWVGIQNESRILDVGTGTGLIALMLAQRTAAEIIAVEIESASCLQATENISASPWSQRASVIHTSVQEFSVRSKAGFDLIVSNPPFFSNSLKTPLQERNLARHNDKLLPEELLSAIDNLLLPEGRFAVILPYIEASLFIVDAALKELYCIRKTMVKSSIQKKPHRVLMEFSRTRKKPEESELIIYREPGEYSEAYKDLTRAFYLSF